MPRETDPFRNYVEFQRNNKWKCKFCKKEYAGSATRIKAHLAGVGGYGINDCKDVDGQVRSEALKVLKVKTLVESSNRQGNVEEAPHQLVIASNEDGRRETSLAAMPCPNSDAISTVGASSSDFLPSYEMNMPSQYLPTQNMITHGDFSFWTPPSQFHAGVSNIQPQNLNYPSGNGNLAALTNMPRPVNAEEGEPNTEVPQDARTEDVVVISRPSNGGLVNENVPSLKRKWKERSNREVVNNCLHCSFRKMSTTHATRCRKSSPLLTTELVGKESKETINKICDYLMKDEIVIIGIYGMGGVGKTAILMHIHNKVLENHTFNDAFWVTVPQEFSVYELQDKIANVVGLDNLSKDKDVERRASILDRHLKTKKRSILLLDGMWMHFEVKDVGIPIKKGGLKLVLTTRSLDVCHKMLCQRQIKIEPLSLRGDHWNLFLEKLCFEKEITSEVEEIAKSIVDKCGGLPLGIIEIATCMRGVEQVHEWKGMLRKLKESRVELNVLKRLKLSYVNLGDSQVQRCFLHLILCFGEDAYHKNDFIESFIDEGLLGGIATWQEQHNEGNIILDKIRKAACLVDDPEEKEYLNVHPLIRDMALQIVTSTTHKVKAPTSLEGILEEEFWTDHLEKVFLQKNDIKKIPHGISPNCPKLTRLSLNDNISLKAIHKSFFSHLRGLKVLDLSNTSLTKLPNIISHLESLEALLLRMCKKLRRIPCVRKFGSLRKLDLWGCNSLEDVPEGMEMLEKLRYLNLLHTKIETLPEEVLGKLVNLQFLMIKEVKLREGIKLKKVEALCCSAPTVETFNSCARLLVQNRSPKYELAFNGSIECSTRRYNRRRIFIGSCSGITITENVDGGSVGAGYALIPENVQVLQVQCCEVMSLREVSPLMNLEVLWINEWEKLEELGSVRFPQLKNLTIMRCSKLKNLFEKELEGINIAASLLDSIQVYECDEMKRVVERGWLTTGLPKLSFIEISNCRNLEEIIGGPLSSVATCGLQSLAVSGCRYLKWVLMMHDMLLHLPFLSEISVECCGNIKVIIGTVPNMTHSFPNLRKLSLLDLPKLNSISDGTVSCDNIEYIHIRRCPSLKRIPLQLPLLDNGLPSPPHSLRQILIGQETWKSLEWDDPRARSTLEPLVEF